MHDCSSIYRVPLLLQEQGVLEFFLERLKITSLETQHSYLHKWRNLADRCVCVWVGSDSYFPELFVVGL